jgi:ribosomal protein L11 methyltransferase
MANILAQPLIMLSSQISQLVRRTGSIILSGVLDEQADNVVKAYSPWFSITNRVSKQGWQLIEGHRNQTGN